MSLIDAIVTAVLEAGCQTVGAPDGFVAPMLRAGLDPQLPEAAADACVLEEPDAVAVAAAERRSLTLVVIVTFVASGETVDSLGVRLGLHVFESCDVGQLEEHGLRRWLIRGRCA